MNFVLLGLLLVLGILAGMSCMVEIGRRLGVRGMARDPEGARAGTGAVETAVLGLMGLLVAFTFTTAASRFDTRRQELVEEANCIRTAWLRFDLLPAKAQPPLRDQLRQYTDARLKAFSKMPDVEAAKIELDRANLLQNEIWAQAVEACRASSDSSATGLLLPALNQMFEMATTRTMVAKMHPPLVIYFTLGLLLLVSSLVAGYHMGEGRRRSWVHTIVFVLVIALAFYVILDFENPRTGLIRIQKFDQVLVDLLQSMQ